MKSQPATGFNWSKVEPGRVRLGEGGGGFLILLRSDMQIASLAYCPAPDMWSFNSLQMSDEE